MSKFKITKFGDPMKGSGEGLYNSNKEVVIKITSLCKVLSPVITGQQRNSYMWKTNKEDGNLNDSTGEKVDEKLNINPKKNSAITGSGLLHTLYQEFGTRYMKAQPTLRLAVKLIIDNKKYVDAIKEILNEDMKRFTKKGI